MTPLTTADLRHSITIRRPSQVSDGKGGYTTSWATIATCFAEVTGLDGREATVEHVLEGVSIYRIRIRWRAGLDVRASDQVQYAGRDLNVTAPASDPDGRREQLVIMASTASAQVS
jgi:SPP1 family predicted phage head-tail adaptor